MKKISLEFDQINLNKQYGHVHIGDQPILLATSPTSENRVYSGLNDCLSVLSDPDIERKLIRIYL